MLSLFYYYSLVGETAKPGRLHARFCYAFLVYVCLLISDYCCKFIVYAFAACSVNFMHKQDQSFPSSLPQLVQKYSFWV